MILTANIFKHLSQVDIRLKPKKYSAEVLKVICDELDFHFGSIILIDEKEKGSMFTSYNLPPQYPQLVNKVSAPVLSSPSGASVETGDIVVVNEVLTDPRLTPWHELLKELDIQTIVWVPLFSKGKAFGTYNLYDSKNKRTLEENEKSILNQLSVLFSMAIRSNEYIDEISEKSLKLENEIIVRKQVEKQLRMAKASLEASNKVKDEFLTNMSHEFRTPLNAIMGYANIMMMDEQDPESQESLNHILDASSNLLNIINSVLNFTEIESAPMEITATTFSMVDLLDEIYDNFFEQAERKKLFFSIGKKPGVPVHVRGDEYKVNLIISNIVDNAIKFTERGMVRVTYTSHNSGNIVITITDTGIGIPAGKQEEIFAPFNQVDNSSTRQYGGIGLGLTIARKLIQRLNGKISLESTPGKGTTFTIEFPLLAADTTD